MWYYQSSCCFLSYKRRIWDVLLIFDFTQNWRTKLYSDDARVQFGKTIQSIPRMYCIEDMQSEPHHQHQNPAERRFQDVKKVSSHIMDCISTRASFCPLSLLCTNSILNRLSIVSSKYWSLMRTLLVRNPPTPQPFSLWWRMLCTIPM
jgi:hypothetical protein